MLYCCCVISEVLFEGLWVQCGGKYIVGGKGIVGVCVQCGGKGIVGVWVQCWSKAIVGVQCGCKGIVGVQCGGTGKSVYIPYIYHI